MKKITNIILLVFLMTMVSSCLKSGLDDLENYNEGKITNLNFEYRWWDEAKNQMAVKTLTINETISDEESLITCKLTVPAASGIFTEAIRQQVSLSALTAYTDISIAARIEPMNGAPKLGVTSDFSAKEFKYLVKAADGTKREWTIRITEFVK